MSATRFLMPLVLLVCFVSRVALAEDGVSNDKILFGSSLRLSGPGAFDGQARKNAMEAIFKKVNASGGVNGRKLELVTLDDKGDKKETAENTKVLIEEKKVFALMNYVGSTALGGALYLSEKAKVPYLAVIQGGESLRRPVKKSVFVVRPSGEAEAEALIKHAVEVLGLKEIAIFTRDDNSGQTGRAYAVKALEKRGIRPVAIGTMASDTSSIDSALKTIMESKAKAVLCVTVGKVGIDFMNAAGAKNFKPIYFGGSSFSPGAVLAEAGKNAEGAVFAFGYPSEMSSIPIAKEFRETMQAAGFKPPEINSYAFEAYVNTKIVIEGLERAGRELTRNRLYSALEGMKSVDIGGLIVSYSEKNHQAFEKVFLTQLKDGKEVPLN